MAAPIHHETLPNGLTLLLREVHIAPVAEVQIWARVGSADEGPGEAGLAHFHEHMLFKGTEKRGVGEIAGVVEGVGGRINAFTTFDTTCYHATLPSAEVRTGLEILSDAVLHSVFDEAEVAREIEVVLEEIRRSEDEPHHVLSDAVFNACYRVHPYRAPILGTAESVAALDREKLLSFYRRWYGPENLVVVAAGDFDARELARHARGLLGSVEPSGVKRNRPAEPEPDATRGLVVRRPFERACLDLSWHSVSMTHPDAANLDLLAFVLGEGDSSRLVRRVKEERGLSDRIDASSYTPLDPGLFGASADLDAEQVLDTVSAIAHEVELLRSELIPDEELEKARVNFIAAKQWERESVSGMARKLGTYQVFADDAAYEDVLLARLQRATSADLRETAQHWLGPERLVAGALVPEATPASIDDVALVDAIERGVASARRRHRAPKREAHAAPTYSYRIDNGIRVHVLPRREVPVVAVRTAMLGGLLAEQDPTAGLTSFLAGMWLRGTRAHSAADFARRVESLAADVDGYSGRNSLGATLDATTERFGETLALMAEVLCSPAFAEAEIEREREDTLAAIERRHDRPGPTAFDLFARTHFLAHPYRLPSYGTPESVASFDADALRAHHARLVRPENLVVAVVGDVDPDDAARQVARELSALESLGEPFARPDPEPAVEEAREAVVHSERAQAHLVIGFRGLTVQDPDREALEVIAQVLSGQGGRLFLELRDKQSLAYSVTATHVEGVDPGFCALYIACAPDKLDEASSGLMHELERLVDEAPSDDELDRARRYLIGSHAIEQQRASNRALHIALDSLYGLDPDAELAYPERVARVTRDDVLRVARRIFTLDRATTALVAP